MTQASLHLRAMQLHELLEHAFRDPAGLFFSCLDAQTRQPFSADQLAGYPLDFPGRPAIEDWFSHENTAMVTGHLLSALGHRLQTSPGPETDRLLEQALAGLRRLLALGESAGGRGWLGKPWGGRPSHESSNDQYAAVIFGLRDLWLVAPASLKPTLEQWLVPLCDHWIDHDYACPYHGKPAHRWMGPHQWGLVCMSFVRIAHEITGEDRYAREAQRLCDTHHCDQATPWAGNFIASAWADRPGVGVRKFSAYHHLVIDSLDALWDAWPARQDHWRQMLINFWRKDIAPGIADDGLLHACYEIDTRTLQWRPCAYGYLQPAGAGGASMPHRHWVGPFKTGSLTCFLAASAVKVARRIPELHDQARRIAHRALLAVDAPRMTASVGEDLSQPGPAGRAIQSRLLDGRAPAQWLRAWWQGRQLGYWP